MSKPEIPSGALISSCCDESEEMMVLVEVLFTMIRPGLGVVVVTVAEVVAEVVVEVTSSAAEEEVEEAGGADVPLQITMVVAVAVVCTRTSTCKATSARVLQHTPPRRMQKIQRKG